MLLELHNQLSASELLTVRYEDFVNQPAKNLAEICNFLGLEATPEYLNACAGILHESPERSRRLVEWEPDWVERVKSQMASYDFLAGYSFEG
jgi:sulfotransferase family protein